MEVNRSVLYKNTDPIRSHCRHQSCQNELKAQTQDAREAFCSRPCWINFYDLHCLVCEDRLEIPETGRKKRFCSAKCDRKYRRKPRRYEIPEIFDKMGISEPVFTRADNPRSDSTANVCKVSKNPNRNRHKIEGQNQSRVVIESRLKIPWNIRGGSGFKDCPILDKETIELVRRAIKIELS